MTSRECSWTGTKKYVLFMPPGSKMQLAKYWFSGCLDTTSISRPATSELNPYVHA